MHVQDNLAYKDDVSVSYSEPASIVKERDVSSKINRNANMLYMVGFLVVCSILVVFICVVYIQMQTRSLCLRDELHQKQSELNNLIYENDQREYEVVNGIDLLEVRERAQELGMRFPRSEQIVFYDAPSTDYVRQYADIPDGSEDETIDK